jgi:hypothetical protein
VLAQVVAGEARVAVTAALDRVIRYLYLYSVARVTEVAAWAGPYVARSIRDGAPKEVVPEQLLQSTGGHLSR